MIFKRYGTALHSVDPHFESKALNEVGFRRNREASMSAEDFDARYERVTVHDLDADAEGPVQDHTEQLMLTRLEERLLELEAGIQHGNVLVVEHGDVGRDYPKTRQRTTNRIEEGETRLHFHYSLEPPLRIGVYRERPRT